jgi:predicted aspartyl protease
MIRRRSLLASFAAMPFAAPTVLRAQDMSRVAMAPISVRDDRVWMPVRFGAGEAHGFILDTGAFANLINRDLALRLGLGEAGSLRVKGIGGVGRYEAYRAPDVSLGQVRVGSMLFAALPDTAGLHPQTGGALSAGLLTVADSDLDFDADQWRLHLDGRRERPGFEALPSTIRSEGPGTGAAQILVDAQIDGQTYRLQVDTGAPGDIMLDTSATRRTGLWNETTPFVPHRRRGIGGDGGRARLVRMGSARLGGIAFDRPIVSLTDPAERRTLDADGLLGIGLIQRLNLSTDLRGRKLWARRNARPPRPERYGMSGLWLGEREGELVIEEVGTGSPAASAGLRKGDRIDGGSLREWVARLSGRPGETVEIPYRRGAEVGTARVMLREYL